MVTISDIAKQAKVSPITVSRIINGNAEYTRPSFANRAAKIRKIAKQMGYMPNTAAQSMRSGRHSCISLLTSDIRWKSAYSGDFLIGMQKALAGLGYNMMLNLLPEDRDQAGKELPRLFKENSVDGVIVGVMRSLPEWLESLIEEMRIPKVWLGTKKKSDCVHHDDFGAAYDITRKLIGRNHEKITYVDIANAEEELDNCHFSVIDKMAGYRKAMMEANLVPQVVRPAKPLPFDRITSFLADQLFGPDRPTAVVAYDEYFSGKSLLCNAWKKGLKVPEDISLAAFADEEIFEDDMKVSAFVPNRDLAATAIRLLYEKINNGNQPHEPVILPFDFIEGKTISTLPEKKR